MNNNETFELALMLKKYCESIDDCENCLPYIRPICKIRTSGKKKEAPEEYQED